MKKRLFLESDILHEDELRTAQRRVSLVLKEQGVEYCKDVFDTKIDFAWHKLPEVLEAIKSTDEIYANSSLLGLCGSYMGSPVIMNEMMKAAIEHKITGKSLIFLRSQKDIDWGMIDIKMLPKCFKNNRLFFTDYEGETMLKEANIKELMKQIKK